MKDEINNLNNNNNSDNNNNNKHNLSDGNINDDNSYNSIYEEYNIWKKNTPFLYDLLITKCIEWPSLTFNWLKAIHCVHSDYQKQDFIIGTQTTNQETNELIFANVKLPLKKNTENNVNFNKLDKKINIELRVNHDGDVNKARVNNKKENIIATKSSNGNVYIFDKFSHKDSKSTLGPQAILLGHSKEGYGLNWNSFEDNIIASGSDDKLVLVWDINSININESNQSTISPILKLEEHIDVVEDVCFSKADKNILLSVGDDGYLKVWDLREKKSVQTVKAHESNVNCVDINPVNNNLILTGSSDCTIGLWDLRNLSKKNYIFDYHNEDVMTVKWNYKIESLFASSSLDKRLAFWDLTKIGNPQSVADSEEGPPELLFLHGGHISRINDIDWNPAEGREVLVGSVEEENTIHIFEPAHQIFNVNDDEIKIN